MSDVQYAYEVYLEIATSGLEVGKDFDMFKTIYESTIDQTKITTK